MIDDKDSPGNPADDQTSLSQFTSELLASPTTLSVEETRYPPNLLEIIQGWINIPLLPADSPLDITITRFFQNHIVASGHETLTWKRGQIERQMNVATADIIAPQRARYDIPTVGWHLCHYTLPDGTQGIYVIAERQDHHLPTGLGSSSAQIHLLKTPTNQHFELQASPDRHVQDTDLVTRRTGAPTNDYLGQLIERAEQQGSQNIQLFHVYNRTPALPPPSTETS